MAKSFNEKLIELLKTDSRFVGNEGELVKTVVYVKLCEPFILYALKI